MEQSWLDHYIGMAKRLEHEIAQDIEKFLNPKKGSFDMTVLNGSDGSLVGFMDALALMEQGHAVKRDIWQLVDGYRMILPGAKNVFMVVNSYSAPQVQWAPLSVEDLNATDWRLVTDADLSPEVDLNETSVAEVDNAQEVQTA